MATIREHWYLLRVGTAKEPLSEQVTTADGIRLTVRASEEYGHFVRFDAYRVDVFVERDVETTPEQRDILRKMYSKSLAGLSFAGLTDEQKTKVASFGSEYCLADTVTAFGDSLTWGIGQQVRLNFHEATVAFDGDPVSRTWWVEAPFRLRPDARTAGTMAEMTSSYPIDRKVTPTEVSDAIRQFSSGLSDPVQLFLEVDAMKWEMRRSAVVMLCACAEWAVKERIAQTHPDTAWLLQEIQSPPIGKMLRRYGSLQVLLGSSLMEEDVKQIDGAFEARNAIVHGKKVVPRDKKKIPLNKEISDAFDAWQASVRKLLVALYPP